jgi:hypothetical protein
MDRPAGKTIARTLGINRIEMARPHICVTAAATVAPVLSLKEQSMNRTLAGLALAASLSALPVMANDDFAPALEAYLTDHVATWASDPALVAAINAQNATTGGYDQAMIDTMDQQWRAEVGAADSAMITAVLHNPAADFLLARVAESGGSITEAFITDAHGLNVAATDITSDYWQGDEDKFSKVFPTPDGHFISEVELDESTQRYQGQISVTIVDPATGAAIGTLTVGVDAETLM